MTANEKKPINNGTAEFTIFTGQAGEQSNKARYKDEPILSAVARRRRK